MIQINFIIKKKLIFILGSNFITNTRRNKSKMKDEMMDTFHNFQSDLYHNNVTNMDMIMDRLFDDWNGMLVDFFLAAVSMQRPEIVTIFLERGVSPNTTNENNPPPLYTAVRLKDCPMVKLLLDHGGDVHIQVKNYPSLLYIAAQNKDCPMVKLLLERGAHIHTQVEGYLPPLHIAAQNKDGSTMSALLKHGADINIQAENGDNVLHSIIKQLSKISDTEPAIRYDNDKSFYIKLIRIFLSKGVNPLLCNKQSLTPKDIASEHKFQDIVDLFPITMGVLTKPAK